MKVFLRTYAENLEIDPVPLVEEYVILSGPPSPQARAAGSVLKVSKSNTPRLRGGLIAAGVIVGLVIVIVLIGNGS